MAQRAMYTGSEAIMEAFDFMSDETPYYSVWMGKQIMASNNTDDLAKGRVKVERMVSALEQGGNNELITIKFHPGADKSGFITDKTAVVSSMTVRAGTVSDDYTQGSTERLSNAQYGYMLQSITKVIDDRITPLNDKIALLESAEPQDEDEGIMGMINKYSPLLEHPAVIGLIQKITGFVMQPPQRPAMVAGIEDTVKDQQVLDDTELNRLNAALNRLAQHCDLVNDLTALADMADKDPATFKFLLSQLKK